MPWNAFCLAKSSDWQRGADDVAPSSPEKIVHKPTVKSAEADTGNNTLPEDSRQLAGEARTGRVIEWRRASQLDAR